MEGSFDRGLKTISPVSRLPSAPPSASLQNYTHLNTNSSSKNPSPLPAPHGPHTTPGPVPRWKPSYGTSSACRHLTLSWRPRHTPARECVTQPGMHMTHASTCTPKCAPNAQARHTDRLTSASARICRARISTQAKHTHACPPHTCSHTSYTLPAQEQGL